MRVWYYRLGFLLISPGERDKNTFVHCGCNLISILGSFRKPEKLYKFIKLKHQRKRLVCKDTEGIKRTDQLSVTNTIIEKLLQNIQAMADKIVRVFRSIHERVLIFAGNC